MIYIIAIIVFASATFLMLIAKDGFINSELDAYQKTLREPWLERLVVMQYGDALQE